MESINTPLLLEVKGRALIELSQDYLAKYGLTAVSLKDLLDTAGERVLSMGAGDVTSQIGELVAQFFVAKMLFVQDRLGLPQYASVVQPPDATIQVSAHKFLRSVPEAASVCWGNISNRPLFVPAEIDVDFCGMITVGLEKALDAVSLAENIVHMKEHLKDLGGQPVDADCIQPGNHFANVYQVTDHERFLLPPFVGVAHLASDEYRERLRRFANQVAMPIETPFGTCLALVGPGAETYWEMAQEGTAFATLKRRTIAQEIFGSDWLLADDGHYQLTTPASCVIGCNLAIDTDAHHVLVSRASESAYLVQGGGEVSAELLAQRGILPGNPFLEDIQRAPILPHGSGHILLEDSSLDAVYLTTAGRILLTTLVNGAKRAVQDYSAVPTQSRPSVLEEALRWRLVRRVTATLHPLCSVKA